MIKQIIVARRDLNMPPGKLAAQVAHASMGAVFQLSKIWEVDGTIGRRRMQVFDLNELPALDKWLNESDFTKIVLGVDSEEELRNLYNAFTNDGLEPVLITDNGKTVFNGVPTATCFGLPPYESFFVDQYTGHLKLF